MGTRSSEVELVINARARTGESPTWCEKEQSLYWIDIEEPALHRLKSCDGIRRKLGNAVADRRLRAL